MDHAHMAGAMLEDVERLADLIVHQVWGGVPGYEPSRLRREELEAAVLANVKAVLEHVITPGTADTASLERASQMGVTRALQGVPLDVVLQSFRVAERIVVEAFLTSGPTGPPDDLRAGLHLLAEGFDELSNAAVKAYRDTQRELTAHYDRISADLLAGLISGDLEPAQVNKMADALDADATAAHQTVASTVSSRLDAADLARAVRRILADLAYQRDGRIITGQVRGADLFLVPGQLKDADLARLRTTLERPDADVFVAVGAPAMRLADAGRSCRQALATLDVAVARGRLGQLTMYDDVLVDTILLQSDDASVRLMERFHRPLLGRPYLVETIEAYFESDMSIQQAAEALFVHPNTVAHRLRKISDLTGLDPRRPRDLMMFWMAGRAPLSDR